MDVITSKRVFGIDIIKIISILLITAIHSIGYSDILDNPNLSIVDYTILTIFDSLSIAAVNLFVLSTGFLQYGRKLRISRIFELWCKVLILSVIICIVAIRFYDGNKLFVIIKSFMPVSSGHYWFFVTYILLCFAVPIFNRMIGELNKRQHLLIIIFAGIIICVFMKINPFVDEQVYLGHSHGIIWFSYLYWCGAYIKRFSNVIYHRYFIIYSVLLFGIIYIIKWLGLEQMEELLVGENNSILSFMFSVCIFNYFSNVNTNNKVTKKITKELIGGAFFVYIIQEHILVRGILWNLFDLNLFVSTNLIICVFFVSLIVLWPISIFYSKCFNKFLGTKVRKVGAFLENKLDSLIV